MNLIKQKNKYKEIRKRFFTVLKIFILIGLDLSREFRLLKKRGYHFAQQRMHKRHEKRAQALFDLAVQQRGLLIKLCQYLSTRQDIFPEPYIRILSSLQDNVPPEPYDIVKRTIRTELGYPERNFKSIDREPLASGSIGQVHRATLKNGKPCVIKIQRSGIEEFFDTDFAILFYVFKVLSNFSAIGERTDLLAVLDAFFVVTSRELDFRREVHNQQRFIRYFKDDRKVKIPKLYPKLCTSKIIVMEFISGEKINAIGQWQEISSPDTICSKVIEVYMEQFLRFSLVHFDPHPGNLLVQKNNTLVLIDFGMAGEITERMKTGLGTILYCFINRDYRKLVEELDSLGFIKKGINRYALLPVVEFMIDTFMDLMHFDRENIHKQAVGPAFDKLLEIIYVQPFVLPTHWAFIVKTFATLFGVITTLNPQVDFYKELAPYAAKVLKDNFLKNAANYLSVYLSLPQKINSIVDDMQRKQFLFPVDYNDLDSRILQIQNFAVKLLAFFSALFSAIGAYIFFTLDKPLLLYAFLVSTLFFSTVTIFFKLTNRKKHFSL